jgi:hypothetical protein
LVTPTMSTSLLSTSSTLSIRGHGSIVRWTNRHHDLDDHVWKRPETNTVRDSTELDIKTVRAKLEARGISIDNWIEERER